MDETKEAFESDSIESDDSDANKNDKHHKVFDSEQAESARLMKQKKVEFGQINDFNADQSS